MLIRNLSSQSILVSATVAAIISSFIALSVGAQGSNRSTKAYETEGKTYVASMNRSQQAYYLENNHFSKTLPGWMGTVPKSKNYDFSTQVQGKYVINYGISRRSDLRSYVGAVGVGQNLKTEDITYSVLCENNKPGKIRPLAPSFAAFDGKNNKPLAKCTAGTVKMR